MDASPPSTESVHVTLSARRKANGQSAIYIEMTRAERERAGERNVTRMVSLRLQEAMRTGQRPTVEDLQGAGRSFNARDTKRQTIWVPSEVNKWLVGLAASCGVQKTHCIRALVPEVFSADHAIPTAPTIPENRWVR